MIRNIIRYVGLALVIVGIVLVMKNLFTSDSNVSDTKIKSDYYTASIELLDEVSNEYVSGATLVLKSSDGEVIEKWITENSNHIVAKLKKGTYVLEQTQAGEGYVINNDSVTFEITTNNKNIVMYNTKEEVKITSSEIGVDNTLSMKNGLSIIVAIASIIAGSMMILKTSAIKER